MTINKSSPPHTHSYLFCRVSCVFLDRMSRQPSIGTLVSIWTAQARCCCFLCLIKMNASILYLSPHAYCVPSLCQAVCSVLGYRGWERGRGGQRHHSPCHQSTHIVHICQRFHFLLLSQCCCEEQMGLWRGRHFRSLSTWEVGVAVVLWSVLAFPG